MRNDRLHDTAELERILDCVRLYRSMSSEFRTLASDQAQLPLTSGFAGRHIQRAYSRIRRSGAPQTHDFSRLTGARAWHRAGKTHSELVADLRTE